MTYEALRSLFGWLFVVDLLALTPGFFRMFGPAYFPGTVVTTRTRAALVYGVWLGAALALATGRAPLAGAATLLVLFRYFHVDHRHDSLTRGAGAVGYMPYLVALYLSCFELARSAGSAELAAHVGWVLRLELAMILFDAGLAKLLSGYARNEGVEYALVNPFWSRASELFARLPTTSFVWKWLNGSGALAEILVALLLAVPGGEALGGIGLIAVFSFVFLSLRLLGLPLLMILLGVLVLPPWPAGAPLDDAASWLSWAAGGPRPALALPHDVSLAALAVALWGMLALQLGLKIVQYANYFLGRSLPEPMQRVVDRLAALLPVFIWRVFTPDVTNFYVRIEVVDPAGAWPLLDESHHRWRSSVPVVERVRFRHAAECVTLSALFGRVKYGRPSAEVDERLLRYARSLDPMPGVAGHTLRMEYVALQKRGGHFVATPALSFTIPPSRTEVTMHALVDDPGEYLRIPGSPVRPTRALGSYVTDHPAELPATGER